ncbi:Rossmann-like and DUF2520 domain-containing protein [Vallitalea okinawensis]|uniref:Rossmann-like and DUF2520 domain-containing protein n=1 Tax=Vallitalea okinawensis TaxID=2078660 RepID=UPI000CFD6898|nr:Rossmann-like and DUF2520 domain-containing protein [Vallitalea okinawensis]
MIGFIGAGQVGKTLGRYFAKHGVQITGYYSRSYESASKGAELTKSQAFKELRDLITTSQLIMMTMPDDRIGDMAVHLGKLNLDWKSKIVCHTSGVHSSALLEPLFQQGVTVASLHPMLSFADEDYALKVLGQTPLTLEGKGTQMNELKKILQVVHLKVRELKTEQKSLYHAAACIVSNYLVTLMDIGIECLVKAGFEQHSAIELIEPLATGTLHNFLEKGSEAALTGPIARGDVGTIRTHLQAISKENKHIEEIYRLLGESTLSIVRKQNQLDEYTLDGLKEVLQNEKGNNRNYQKNENEK